MIVLIVTIVQLTFAHTVCPRRVAAFMLDALHSVSHLYK